MRLICLHGAPGVGKLSVARQLQNLSGAILVHDHLVIDAATSVFPFGKSGFSELRSALFARLLDASVATGRELIVTHADDLFWTPSFDELIRPLGSQGYEILHVLLVCEEREHGRRISNPSRSKYQKITDIERLNRLTAAGEFEPLSPDNADKLLDITELPPSSAAFEISSWVQSKNDSAALSDIERKL